MAQYPIKMLKDENGTPFVPLVAPEAVKDTQGTDWQTLLNRKLEKTNIIAGQNVTITTEGNDITINSAAGGASANVIDNLNQTTGGVGVLDAHQGHVLKEMIPDVVNNLTTVDTTKALSAYQGYLLNNRTVPGGGTTGQVLKKKSGTDNDLEWGDAADPNAISGDSSIKKIVALTYDEYEQLVADDEVEQDTEYHITDAPDAISGLQHEIDDLQDQLQQIETKISYITNTSETALTPISQTNYKIIGYNSIIVRNGICFIQAYIQCITPGDVLWATVPPCDVTASKFTHWEFQVWEQVPTAAPIVARFQGAANNLNLRGGTAGASYYIYIVYPVKIS